MATVGSGDSLKVYGDVAQMAADGGTYNFVDNATASRTDFTVSGSTTLNLNSKTVTVSNGKAMTITGGTFTSGTIEANGGTVTITGGTFTGVTVKKTSGTFEIKGGTFSVEPSDDCIAENYAAKDNGDGTWTVGVSQMDISTGTTITLTPAEEFYYDGTSHSVSIASVVKDGNAVTYDLVDGSEMSGTEVKENYTVTIQGTGNFTGTATKTWSIVNSTGAFSSVTATDTASTTLNDKTLTVSDSTKLVYNGGCWWAGITFDWGSSWDASTARFMVGDKIYTGNDFADGKINFDGGYLEQSGTTTTWWKSITLDQVSASTSAITQTIRVGSVGGVAFNDYTITFPAKDALVLYSGTADTTERRRVWPTHTHVWSIGSTDEGQVATLTASCAEDGCDKRSVSITLTGSAATPMTYKNVAYTCALSDTTAFEVHTGYTVNKTIVYKNVKGETLAEAPKDAGTYTASVTATLGDATQTLVKNFTITQVDLSTATVDVVLENNGTFAYDGTEKTANVTSVKVGDYTLVAGTDYTVSGNKQTWYGNYTLTIQSTGNNFTGSKTAGWKINNVTTSNGGAINASVTTGGLTTSDNQNFTITAENSGNLEYVCNKDGTHTWWATITLKYERDIDNCESLSDDYGHAYYTTPTAARFTVDGKMYTVEAAKNAGGSIYFDHSIASVSTESPKYYYGRISAYIYDISYVDTITYRVGFTLGEAEAAIDAGKPLTFTINAGAVQESSSNKGVSLRAVEFKDYTITIPVNDADFKLYAGNTGDERRRVYPAHTHNWTFTADSANGTMTATCDASDCDHKEAAISLNGTASRAYDGTPLTLTLSDTTAFTTHTGATVGDIVYAVVGDGSLTDGKPVNAGTYTASVTVTDANSGTHTFSKTITISKVSIADATVVLGLGYEPWYTRAEQNQTVTSVTASGLAATYNQTGVFCATNCGTYSITLEGTDNFTGTKTVTWTIKEAEGSLASVGAAYCTTEGNVTTVSESTSLMYDGGGWWIQAAFTWSSWDAANARFTVDGVMYTGTELAGGAKWHDSWYFEQDGNVSTVYIPFTVDDIKAATDGKLSYTVNVGSIGTVAFKDYVFEVPISDSLVLYDDDKNQCWPEHTHNWPALAVTAEGNVASSTCAGTGKDCTIGTVSITLNANDAEYDGNAHGATYEKSADFDTFFGSTAIGTITYWQGETQLDSAPKYTGNYTAKLSVGDLTLAKDFAITKPAGGYTSGWEVASTGVRYDEWTEARDAAADGDTVYCYDGNAKDDQDAGRWFSAHEYAVSKNLTLDFCGKVLSYESMSDMTIENDGEGLLTLQNVVIKQPRWGFSGHVNVSGNVAFGVNVVTSNTAEDSNNNLVITATSGKLQVLSGVYFCKFEADGGTVEISGGNYGNSAFCKPASGMLKTDYIVITAYLENYGNYYSVVYHKHGCFAYAASGNVISASCTTNNHEYCGFDTQTATLTAGDATETTNAYAGASVAYSNKFPQQDLTIQYYSGTAVSDDARMDGVPTLFGTYTAAITVGGATASKTFTISLNTSDASKTEPIVNPAKPDSNPISIPASFIAKQVKTAGKTTEEIMTELTETRTEGNKLTLVESYVLGLDPKDETSVPTVLPIQTSTVGELTLKAGNINVKTDAGATVKYTLETSTDVDFSTPTTLMKAQTSDTFSGISLPDSGVRYYRIKIDLE